MRQFGPVLAVILTFAPSGFAEQTDPYKVLKRARVGGEGSWDYIYADVAGRRLYIPRRGTPAAPEVQTRLSIYNLDTLEQVSEIAGVGGQGAAGTTHRLGKSLVRMGTALLTVVKEKNPTNFEVEQNLDTMNGARTIALDAKTNHIFTMSQERGPAPAAPPGGSRPPQGTSVPGSFTILVIGK